MKINGAHKFKASSQQVFHAILNPQVLQSCIPGCDSVEYLDANCIQANVTLPLPGLKGVFAAVIYITKRQEPKRLTLQKQRAGKGGSINTTSQIKITGKADGGLLTYHAPADPDRGA